MLLFLVLYFLCIFVLKVRKRGQRDTEPLPRYIWICDYVVLFFVVLLFFSFGFFSILKHRTGLNFSELLSWKAVRSS